MASPFPGIDPHIENPAFWSDFHSAFINYWREAIADALPDNYEARIGERVYLIEHEPDARKLTLPDIAITDVERARSRSEESDVVTLEPVTIPLTILDGPRETFIEIIHRPDRSLVTALELLSPANKNQPGRTEYLAKRNALLYQHVHLVELDILRGGQRLPLAKALPRGDAYYFVSRDEQRPDCQVYSWMLAHELPVLPVPLRAPDADLRIDLAAVYRTAYERGRFQKRIDYRGAPPTQLTAEEIVWPEAVLGTAK